MSKYIKINIKKLRKKYPTIYKCMLYLRKEKELYLNPKLSTKIVDYELNHCESFLKKIDKKMSDIVRPSDIRKIGRDLKSSEKNKNAIKVFCFGSTKLTIMLENRYKFGDEAYNVFTQLWDLYEEGGNY